MSLRVICGKILYNVIAKRLPLSHSKINIGQQKLRAYCGKLIMKSVGKNINIEHGAKFSHKVSLGDDSGIGVDCFLQGEVIIGKDVMMGPECLFYTRNHEFSDITKPINQQGVTDEQKITVGDDVWIGSRVIVLPGVKVGSHSVIGAGSVVTRDVPEWSVVAGNPAKVCRMRKNNLKEI